MYNMKRVLRQRFGVVLIVIGLITIFSQLGYLNSTHPLKLTKITVSSIKNQKTPPYVIGGTNLGRKPREFEEYNDFGIVSDIDWRSEPTSANFKPTFIPSGDEFVKRKYYTRVAFLKTHKSGSSTAQNIFLRYGESRNLTFVLAKPREGHYDNVIGLQNTLNENNTLPPPSNKTFDILCCHVLYNRYAFQKFLPNDTAYIAILREPFEQFLSTLNYFGNHLIFRNSGKSGYKVLQYLKNPWKYERELKPYWSFTNNRMAVEFGFPANLFINYSKGESAAYLDKLDREFVLVIVLEYFMESIVLMRRILGWSVKDILFLNKNVARRDYSFVDNTHRYMYENFAKLDYDLYNHFYARLWKQISREGIDFHYELLYFRRLRKEIEDYCRYSWRRIDMYSTKRSKWSEPFNVTHTDCILLRMHEVPFVAQIRKRQYG